MKIKTSIFAIDFEGSKKCGVVEFGAVEISGGEIIEAHTAICAPRSPISARDERLFGIANAAAEGKAPFETHLEFFASLRARGIFASHNRATEDGLLRSYSPIAPRVPAFLEDGKFCNTWGPWLDTLLFIKNVYPDMPSGKLSEAVAVLGLQAELDELAKKFCPSLRRKWHCALYDALASALLITSAMRHEAFADAPLQWLAKYSGTPEAGQGSIFF